MDFVSIVFFSWLVLFVIVSWISVNKYSQYILVAFGLTFVFTTVPLAGGILVAESLLCFFACLRHKRFEWLSSVLSVSIVFIAFLLCKYFALKHSIVLPLGISYFSFRLMHYVQENYRQRLREHSLTEFLAYMTFFPTYLVGPINLFPEFLQNLRRRKWDNNQFSYGLERIFYGYAQLIIFGNYFINHLLKDWIAGNFVENNTITNLTLHSMYQWLDLYIRFSAYSSIAIGVAAIAGFTVPENFHYPFFAANIREFWQRWHMSLTNWCREYVFVPLAAISRKPFLAIGATMITIGIWHELSLRYILWGVYHSIGIIVYEKYYRITKGRTPNKNVFLIMRKVTGIAVTLVFVILSFPVTSIVNNFLMNLVK